MHSVETSTCRTPSFRCVPNPPTTPAYDAVPVPGVRMGLGARSSAESGRHGSAEVVRRVGRHWYLTRNVPLKVPLSALEEREVSPTRQREAVLAPARRSPHDLRRAPAVARAWRRVHPLDLASRQISPSRTPVVSLKPRPSSSAGETPKGGRKEGQPRVERVRTVSDLPMCQ
jgi:hypothetical protein